MGDQKWVCPRCKLSVTGSCKRVRLIRGEVIVRYRCTHCKARYDTLPGEAAPLDRFKKSDRTLLGRCEARWVARRIRRSNRKVLKSYRQDFLRDLSRYEHLSEIARSEGSWRSM